jgi:Protein of unknown function (DUF4254)
MSRHSPAPGDPDAASSDDIEKESLFMSSIASHHGAPPVAAGRGRGPLVIPRSSMVVRAFSNPGEVNDRHPVLAVAAKLATEHWMRAEAQQLTHDPHADDHMVAAAARAITARETACAVLIDQIDRWAAVEFSESRGAALHTESFGQVVDRLATVWTRSRLTAENDTSPAALAWARVALHQLGELCTGYDDLVSDIERGRRRLPLYQTPTGPDVAA